MFLIEIGVRVRKNIHIHIFARSWHFRCVHFFVELVAMSPYEHDTFSSRQMYTTHIANITTRRIYGVFMCAREIPNWFELDWIGGGGWLNLRMCFMRTMMNESSHELVHFVLKWCENGNYISLSALCASPVCSIRNKITLELTHIF